MQLAILWLLLAIVPNPATAGPDTIDEVLRNQFPTELRWDNVEGAPHWLGGPTPSRRLGERSHWLKLETGAAPLHLWVPRGSWLRLHGMDGSIAPGEFRVMTGDGTGFFHAPPLLPMRGGRDVLLPPDTAKPRYLLLSRTSFGNGPRRVSLFVSRYQRSSSVATYRGLVAVPNAPERQVRRSGWKEGMVYWQLDPQVLPVIELNGPARYRVEIRRLYEPEEGERRQRSWLHVDLEASGAQSMQIDAYPDEGTPTLVDGAPTVLGRAQAHYLQIPAGQHRATLRVSASMLVRVRAELDRDFLFPRLGGPPVRAPDLYDRLPPPASAGALWEAGDSVLQWVARQPLATSAELAAVAERLANDRRYEDSGLLAAQAMRAVASWFPAESELQAIANRLYGRYSVYRDLLPAQTPPDTRQRRLAFQLPRFTGPRAGYIEHSLALQHLDQVLEDAEQGFFQSLQGGKGGALLYRLPKRSIPSTLRLVVNQRTLGESRTLYLSMDDAPPIALLATATSSAPDEHRRATLLDIGLRARDTLLTSAAQPQRIVPAGAVELALPPNIRQLRLWAEPEGSTVPLEIALHYRVGTPATLGESEYLALLAWLGGEQAVLELLLGFLRGTRITAATTDPSDPRELAEHALTSRWLDLKRLIQARAEGFAEGSEAREHAPRDQHPLPRAVQQRLAVEARDAEARGDRYAALALWSRLQRQGNEPLAGRATLAAADTLLALGEYFLAESQLRGIYLFSEDRSLADKAFRALLAFYSEDQRALDLQGLMATELLRTGSLTRLAAFAAQLASDGDGRSALMLLTALPRRYWPNEVLADSALTHGWWRTFDTAVAAMEPRRRQTWLGLRAVRQGCGIRAREHWREAGATGSALTAALDEAMVLPRHAWTMATEQVSGGAIAWADWQARLPGPRHWRREPELVSGYAGGELLYNPRRDLAGWWHRADPDRPVTLDVTGPLRLRLAVRPVHSGEDAPAKDGWLRIRSTVATPSVHPINGNRPVRSLVLATSPESAVGAQVETIHVLEGGRHVLHIDAIEGSLLVRVYAERPSVAPAIARAGEGPNGDHATVEAGSGDVTVQSPFLTSPLPSRERAGESEGLPGDCRPCNNKSDPATRACFLTARGVDLGTRAATRTTLTAFDPDDRPIASPSLPTISNAAETVNGTDLSAVVALQVEPAKEDVEARLCTLLWAKEQEPALAGAALARAQAIYDRHRGRPGLQSLMRRMTRDFSWQPVKAVVSDAGLYRVPVSGWRARSPEARLRQALLGGVSNDDHLITGHGRLVLSLYNLEPMTVQLELELRVPVYLPVRPQIVSVQLNEAPPTLLTLSGDGNRIDHRLELPAGEHSVRIALPDPLTNHSVRLRFGEIERNGALRPLIRETVQDFHVATSDEPVMLAVDGPAWVRIDERRGNDTVSRYRFLEAGERQLSLTPAPGQSQAYYLVYRQTPDNASDRLPSAEPLALLSRAATPFPNAAPDPAPLPVALVDDLKLGGQEDGTWSFSTSAVSRRRADDEDESIADDRFFELRATHRLFADEQDQYTRLDMLARRRDNGGPTFGAVALLEKPEGERPFALDFAGSLYLQKPGTRVAGGESGTEWAATLRAAASQHRVLGPKTYHRPAATAFLRYLSLSDYADYEPERVDQDVFTPYKDDHRRGLSLGDVLYHRPWQDTLWSVGVRVQTNEDLNPLSPDHLGLRLGWNQFMGNMRVAARYRHRRFFSDEDRSEHRDSNRLALQASWELWRNPSDRLELGLALARDLDAGDTSWALRLSWSTSNGRGYRDFRPREESFLDLRSRRIPVGSAPNRLIYEHTD